MLKALSTPNFKDSNTTNYRDRMDQPLKPHPIFKNDDIISIIIPFLHALAPSDAEQHIANKNLLSAALTCKSFFGPATNLLWSELDSVLPLLQVLPSCVYIEEDGIYTINEVITPIQWEKLTSYGAKVRTLSLLQPRGAIRPHIIHHLANRDPPLFPNLADVSINGALMGSLEDIFLAISPSLENLRIFDIDITEQDIIIYYFQTLNQRKAPIKLVYLRGYLTTNTLRALNQFVRLTTLDITLSAGVLDFFDLWSWSSLLSLTSLNIDLGPATMFNLSIQNRATLEFPVLETLVICGVPVEILALLRSIKQSKILTAVTITIVIAISPVDPEIVSYCVGECVRISQSLKKITWDIKISNPHLLYQYILPTRSILFLSNSLPSLQCLEISRNVFTPYGDREILSMSQNWGNLTILALPYAIEGGYWNPAPSIHSLAVIAKQCPNLSDLDICVDFRIHTPQSLLAERTSPRLLHKLRYLSLSRLPTSQNHMISDMRMSMAISRFIEHHFIHLGPESSRLESHYPQDQGWWHDIMNMVEEYRLFREEATSTTNSEMCY